MIEHHLNTAIALSSGFFMIYKRILFYLFELAQQRKFEQNFKAAFENIFLRIQINDVMITTLQTKHVCLITKQN